MEQGNGEQVTSSTPLSTLVAVALIKNGSRSWHRGKLEAVTQFQRNPPFHLGCRCSHKEWKPVLASRQAGGGDSVSEEPPFPPWLPLLS